MLLSAKSETLKLLATIFEPGGDVVRPTAVGLT
jgi:hypothetical protein